MQREGFEPPSFSAAGLQPVELTHTQSLLSPIRAKWRWWGSNPHPRILIPIYADSAKFAVPSNVSPSRGWLSLLSTRLKSLSKPVTPLPISEISLQSNSGKKCEVKQLRKILTVSLIPDSKLCP